MGGAGDIFEFLRDDTELLRSVQPVDGLRVGIGLAENAPAISASIMSSSVAEREAGVKLSVIAAFLRVTTVDAMIFPDFLVLAGLLPGSIVLSVISFIRGSLVLACWFLEISAVLLSTTGGLTTKPTTVFLILSEMVPMGVEIFFCSTTAVAENPPSAVRFSTSPVNVVSDLLARGAEILSRVVASG